MNTNLISFSYKRDEVKAGILHFGVGNFHRAHLEYLTNLLLENNPDQHKWGICGAMILPSDERMYNALRNQNGEYTLTICGRDGKDETWLIGSLVELYWGMNNQEAILNKIADWCKKYPAKKITVSGYADKGTGNPKINAKYAQQRAEKVAKSLQEKGVAADRMTVNSYGDTVQPFAENDRNRCVIVVGE